MIHLNCVSNLTFYFKKVIKYLTAKTARLLIKVIKSTQHATKEVYKLVPIQDFSSNSDIIKILIAPRHDRFHYFRQITILRLGKVFTY